MDFYTYKYLGNSVYECEIDLTKLYSTSDLQKFYVKYKEFCASDSFIEKVVAFQGNKLIYKHKSWIPEKRDERPKVLFVFGNPAPHSVLADVYFAYEGKGMEHRFWKVMRAVGLISIEITKATSEAKDKEIKEKFFELDYKSPFILGLDVLHTFPSAASHPKWSGVMGLQKLFGKKVFDLLTQAETIRVHEVIKTFLDKGGKIVCCQKDAYNALVQNQSMKYDIRKAVEGELVSDFTSNIELIGIPPTRWLYTAKMKRILSKIASLDII